MTREEQIRKLAEHERKVFWTRMVVVTAVLIVLAFVAYAVHAATVPSYAVSLYKSTTKVKDISADTEAAAFAACFAEAKALQATTASKVTCKTPVLSLATAPDPPPMTATLSWSASTQNTDGSQLTNLAGYRVYYGTSPNSLTQSVQLGNVTTYVVQSLTAGTWYFAVSAYTTGNLESDRSNVVSKTL